MSYVRALALVTHQTAHKSVVPETPQPFHGSPQTSNDSAESNSFSLSNKGLLCLPGSQQSTRERAYTLQNFAVNSSPISPLGPCSIFFIRVTNSPEFPDWKLTDVLFKNYRPKRIYFGPVASFPFVLFSRQSVPLRGGLFYPLFIPSYLADHGADRLPTAVFKWCFVRLGPVRYT